MTILTATSGDTGAAVALAFHGLPGIEVVVLYPEGGVTPLQEKLFCTLGGNVRTYSVAADFDACQGLVKKAFEDARLRQGLGLNSANSINIARLLAQVCYYFEAIAGLPERGPALCSVPSGNFGNVTAGLIARRLGLPVRLMAATNANDTVPRYFEQGRWAPRATVKTITNAMDISQPNNFDRVLDLEQRHGLALAEVLSAVSVSEDETRAAIAKLDQLGYLADPHSALAWQGMQSQCRDEEAGIFLCTAHPAKFRETIESVIGREIELPEPLSRVLERPVLSESIPADYEVLRDRLLNRA